MRFLKDAFAVDSKLLQAPRRSAISLRFPSLPIFERVPVQAQTIPNFVFDVGALPTEACAKPPQAPFRQGRHFLGFARIR